MRSAAIAVLSVALLAVATLSGQSKWTPAHTAWGDPDLQGLWSYNDDVNTPFERPGELAGKPVVGDEELAELLEARARRNVERAPTIGGETGAGPVHWYEFWNAKSARTSRVIDPPDGRVPALTPAAQKREAARCRSTTRAWPVRLLGGSQPGRPVHRVARRLAARGGEPGQLRQHHPRSTRARATW